GLLSGDTWRAIAVVSRNLVLTWLMFIPLLLATVMAAQAYFVINPATSGGFLQLPLDASVHNADLQIRLLYSLVVPGFLYIGVIVAVVLWMLATRRCWALRDIVIVIVSGLGFVLILLFSALAAGVNVSATAAWTLGGSAIFFVIALALYSYRAASATDHRGDNDFWRNRIVQFHTTLLTWTALTAILFLFGGFGHEVIDLLLHSKKLQNAVADSVVRAGGWTGILMTITGTLYTVLKAAPSGGDDRVRKAKPGLVNRIVFALVPPLLLIVLSITMAWLGHRAVVAVVHGNVSMRAPAVAYGAITAAFLFLFFALYEFRPRSSKAMLVLVLLWLAIALAIYLVPPRALSANIVSAGFGLAVFIATALIVRATYARRRRWLYILCAVAGGATWIICESRGVGTRFTLYQAFGSGTNILIAMAFLFSFSLLLFELIYGRGANLRSFMLLTIGFAIAALLAVALYAGPQLAPRAIAVHGIICTILGFVLALGWLADPNSLSLHEFYRARLVRAYLGASNKRRHESNAEVTDAVPGDDVLLTDLKNCDVGAPYHLINTTLNLVGGHDLSTAQRFSDMYVLSKRYCGSMRTGFRKTAAYACGTMSLGTAVAISGAAASPNMGSQTPSAATAMLLTLFNVRLGFWAPTPHRSYWRSTAARLWPVYSASELLSQTTDLLPFCYLTDGGHFDNSGVYSLIQRGCRFILYSDCGADPFATFDDLGELIRKVRIDFGTEITLDIASMRSPSPGVRFIRGSIVYSQKHAEYLGLADNERIGVIIVVKPNRAVGPPVDVLQYGFANDTFPQQTTVDQWYDEAQFESYRQLGELSGISLVERLGFSPAKPPRTATDFFTADAPKPL
ncbi:MAG TPA: hypothetical protein VKL19_08495, partial [Thermoanaerobaculia bacterium]|nr:hypothetical protein [Thermoanaerobaculia bacterium]